MHTTSATLRARLHWCSLRSHLADLCRLPPRCAGRSLRLLHLLLALAGNLLLLGFLYRCLAGCLAGFGTLGTALFDDVEGGADDASLLLYRAASTLFSDFLGEKRRLVVVLEERD